MADCVSVRLDMSLLVNTSIGEEVQLPEGPSLKLVRRNLHSAVFQVVRYFWLDQMSTANLADVFSSISIHRMKIKLYPLSLSLSTG